MRINYKNAVMKEDYSFITPSSGATIITRGKQELAIFYDRREGGLCHAFDRLMDGDEQMADYIKKNPEEAFFHSIIKIDDNHYALNIADCIDRSPTPEYSDEWKRHVEKQTMLFMPIIEKFLDEGCPCD